MPSAGHWDLTLGDFNLSAQVFSDNWSPPHLSFMLLRCVGRALLRPLCPPAPVCCMLHLTTDHHQSPCSAAPFALVTRRFASAPAKLPPLTPHICPSVAHPRPPTPDLPQVSALLRWPPCPNGAPCPVAMRSFESSSSIIFQTRGRS